MASHNKGTRIDGALNFHKASRPDSLKYLRGCLAPNRMTREDVQAFRERYRENPVRFCSEILGLELDANQQKIADSVKLHRRTACISARGCGKSVCISALAIWYFVLAPHTKVIVGANTHSQSYSVLWLKILELIQGSGINSWFDVSQDYIYWKGAKDLGYIKRITCNSDNVENLSGYHAPHMLILLDEASSIPDKIILNLLSGMTELDNRMCLTTNPTRNTGFMSDIDDDPDWEVIHVDGFSSRFTDKDHLKQLIEKYGEDSDIVRVQVRGLFPKDSTDILVPKSVFDSCVKNENFRDGDVILGLDVAASGGDLSVWCIRRGGQIIAMESESSSSVESLVTRTVRLVEKYYVDRVFVDATGMGWTIPEILEKNLPNTEINGINFAEKAPSEQYKNYRAFMYCQLASKMKEGCIDFSKIMDYVPYLKEELMATEVVVSQNGQFQLSPKENIRHNLGRSPDNADALALTFATDTPFLSIPQSVGKKELDNDLFDAAYLWS